MCKFQDKVSFIFKPRNLIWETSVITLLLHAIAVSVDTLFFVLKYIQCIFKNLIVNIFDLDQLYTNLRFVFNLAFILPGFPSVITILVSSANNIGADDLFMADGKLFIYSKNNKGPKTEPYGAPCLILDQFDAKDWPLDLTFNFIH
jgi:hypothetical protein